MKLILCLTTLCLIPLYAAGQIGNFEMTFDSGTVVDLDPATNPLDTLKFTLNYILSANVNNVDEPEAYEGACTESPPASKAPMSTISGINFLSAVTTTPQIEFEFKPELVPASWEPTVNNFVFCVFFKEKNGKVFEEVTIDLTLNHNTFDDKPVVSFDSSSNGVNKLTTLNMNGKDVLATAALCTGYTPPFQIGQEICVQIGLDAAGEYFGYKLDDPAVSGRQPFVDIAFTDPGPTLTETVTPSTPETTVVPVGDAVNSQKVYFYLSNEFYYTGSRTVTGNGNVNIMNAYGAPVSTRRRLAVTMDVLPGEIHNDVGVRFSIIPVTTQEAHLVEESAIVPHTPSLHGGADTTSWCLYMCITVIVLVFAGTSAGCCCVAAALYRKKQEDEEKEKKKEGHHNLNNIEEGTVITQETGTVITQQESAELSAELKSQKIDFAPQEQQE